MWNIPTTSGGGITASAGGGSTGFLSGLQSTLNQIGGIVGQASQIRQTAASLVGGSSVQRSSAQQQPAFTFPTSFQLPGGIQLQLNNARGGEAPLEPAAPADSPLAGTTVLLLALVALVVMAR